MQKKIRGSNRYLHMSIHSSIIPMSQKVEMTHALIDSWADLKMHCLWDNRKYIHINIYIGLCPPSSWLRAPKILIIFLKL